MKTLFLNAETTGLSPPRDKLVEVVIIDLDGQVLMNTLVNPGRKIGSEAIAIHHITDDMVATAPTLRQLWPEIQDIVRDSHLIIYNSAFITRFFPDRLGCARKVTCAMERFARIYGEWNSKYGNYRFQKLIKAAKHVGYTWGSEAHRALGNVLATRAVWKWMEKQESGDEGEDVAQDDAQEAQETICKPIPKLQKAAEQGHAWAQCNLGVRYSRGKDVAQDDAQAVEWYRKAAEQGLATAQFNLGVMYRHGKGVAQDDLIAAWWWRKAAAQGDADAQHNLSLMYDQGEGVAQDDAQAVADFRKERSMLLTRQVPNTELIDLIRYGVVDAYYFLRCRASTSENANKKLSHLREIKHTFLFCGDFLKDFDRNKIDKTVIFRKLNCIDEDILELPAKILAAPILPTRVSKALMTTPLTYLIDDLCKDLNEQELPTALDCHGRARQKLLASIVFLNWISANNRTVRHEENLDYVVPTNLLDSGEDDNQFRVNLSSIIRDSDPKLIYWFGRLKDIKIWLPHFSLELFTLVSSWQEPRKRAISESLAKLSKLDSTDGTPSYPWDSKFPSRLCNLPIFVLYQFKPNKIMRSMLEQLYFKGYTNISSLMSFHPEALRVMRKRNKEKFKRLYKALNS